MKQATKQRMIESALELFHQNGVKATSVDDILKKSGTGKSQFTHYFQTKTGLVHAVIHDLADHIRNGHTPTGYKIRNWKEMERWFQTYIDFQASVEFKRSCPIGTIANDLLESEAELEVRDDVIAFLDWARGELLSFFKEKVASGELPKSTRPQALADLCIATMQGGMLLTKIRRDSKMFSNAASEVLSYLKSLRRAARGST